MQRLINCISLVHIIEVGHSLYIVDILPYNCRPSLREHCVWPCRELINSSRQHGNMLQRARATGIATSALNDSSAFTELSQKTTTLHKAPSDCPWVQEEKHTIILKLGRRRNSRERTTTFEYGRHFPRVYCGKHS